MRNNYSILLILVLSSILMSINSLNESKIQNNLIPESHNPEISEDESIVLTNQVSSIKSPQGISGIGSHLIDFEYSDVDIYYDHDSVGKGEWHFHVGAAWWPLWFPNAPYDDSITIKVEAAYNWSPACFGLDNRWKYVLNIGSSNSWVNDGVYEIVTIAWEEDTWPLPVVDPESESKASVKAELQGNGYSGGGTNVIAGEDEVNRYIYKKIKVGDVGHGILYYIYNDAPTSTPIFPQNPTIFANGSIDLTGYGTDPDGDRITYEWDLDYDGVTFNVDITGSTISPTFTEGTHLVAYRGIDPFYGANTPSSPIQVTVVTANPSDAPFIDQPEEINYERGMTGSNITWHPYDDNPNEYIVTRVNATSINDSQIVEGPITWDNISIVLDIDGYPLGTYYFTCNVSDNDAHASSSTVTVNVIERDNPTIDHHPESINFNEGALGHDITWNVTDENPASFTITRNGLLELTDPWNGTEIITNVDHTPAGIHIYNCTVYDKFGNSASDIIEVTVHDITSPAIFLTTLANSTTHFSGTAVNITIWDNQLDSVLYNWDGSTNQSSTGSTILTLLPSKDTQHLLTVYANDTSGNWVTQKLIFFTDDSPPAISFYSPILGTMYTSNQIDVIFAGAAENYWYYIEGFDTHNHTWPPVATRILNEGTYTIHGYANDSVGNIGYTSTTFTISRVSSTSESTPTSSTESATSGTSAPTIAIGWVIALITMSTFSMIIRRRRKLKKHT